MFFNRVQRGFTLIELLVTLALVAIMMGVAAPSFMAFQRNAELSSLTNTLLAGMNAARGEAMKRGRNAFVSPVDNTKWSSGWVVYVDIDGSQSFNASDVTVLTSQALPAHIAISGTDNANASPPYILFDALGYSKKKNGGFGALTFTIARNDVSAGQALAETRRLIIASTGRVRSCKPATDASCTASAIQ